MAGIGRILFGLFKKVVVADQLAAFVNIGINDVAGSNAGMRLLSFYLFPLQLFTDFSALTDIANGIARLFGIDAPENFEAPFTAASISEFWRRWHMTLTGWLRNYVFTPMLMATRNWGKFGLAFSLAVNMVLIGLWHGFTVAFLVFGLTHAAYLIVDAFTLPYRKRLYKQHPVARGVTSVLGPILTYHQVAAANVFFRAVNFRDGVYLITHLLSGSAGALGEILQFVKASGLHSLVALGGYTTVEIMEYGRRHRVSGRFVEVAPRWGRWSLYSGTIIGLMILLWLILDQQGAEFIYAQF